MSEEEKIEPSETTSTETQPEPAETPSIDYDKLENDFLGIKPEAEAEQSLKPEETTTEEQATETPKKYTFKADGQDIDLEIKNDEELIEYLRKGYTWDEKVKKLSEERKTFETDRESFTKERELIQLENLAWQFESIPKEPIHDPYGDAYENLVSKYGKEEADKFLQTHEFVTDTAELAMKQQSRNDIITRAQQVLTNRQNASRENEKNITAFKTKYGIDDNAMTELVKKADNYIGYAVTKGQKPLPEDAFEILYRGMNYDTLLKSEIQKLNTEWEAKFKTEKEKWVEEFSTRKPKPKPAPVRTAPKIVEKEWMDEMEDRIVGINN